MAGEGSWSGARSSSRFPASIRPSHRTHMTPTTRRALFGVLLWATALLLRAASTATGAPASVAPAPAGDSLSLPPRALRVEWVLDRDALEQAGIRRPSRLAYDQDGNLHVLDAETRRVTKL